MDDDTNNIPVTPFPHDDTPLDDPVDVPPVGDNKLDDTHPITDTNIQPEEEYDEGLSGASEAHDPNADSDVTEYHPGTK